VVLPMQRFLSREETGQGRSGDFFHASLRDFVAAEMDMTAVHVGIAMYDRRGLDDHVVPRMITTSEYAWLRGGIREMVYMGTHYFSGEVREPSGASER
jgi:hypothetical protein